MSNTFNSTEITIDKNDPVFKAKRQAGYQQVYRDKQLAKKAELIRLAQQVPLLIQDKETTVLQLQEQLQRRDNEIIGKNDEVVSLEAELDANLRDLERLQIQLQQRDNDLISKDNIIQQYNNELRVKNEESASLQLRLLESQNNMSSYLLQIQSLQQRNKDLEANAAYGQERYLFLQWLTVNGPEHKSVFDQCFNIYKNSPK